MSTLLDLMKKKQQEQTGALATTNNSSEALAARLKANNKPAPQDTASLRALTLTNTQSTALQQKAQKLTTATTDETIDKAIKNVADQIVPEVQKATEEAEKAAAERRARDVQELILVIDESQSIRKNFFSDDRSDYRGNPEIIQNAVNNALKKYSNRTIKVTICCFSLTGGIREEAFRQPINECSRFHYNCQNGTNFYDAACHIIDKVKNTRQTNDEQGPITVAFVSDRDIYLSSWEKSSRHTANTFRNRINDLTQGGWEFMFLATNGIDRELCQAIENLGISAERIIKSSNTNFESKVDTVMDVLAQQAKGHKGLQIHVADNLSAKAKIQSTLSALQPKTPALDTSKTLALGNGAIRTLDNRI